MVKMVLKSCRIWIVEKMKKNWEFGFLILILYLKKIFYRFLNNFGVEIVVKNVICKEKVIKLDFGFKYFFMFDYKSLIIKLGI